MENVKHNFQQNLIMSQEKLKGISDFQNIEACSLGACICLNTGVELKWVSAPDQMQERRFLSLSLSPLKE